MSRKLLKFLSLSTSYNIIKRSAGHSKWANIRHIKAQKDSQKSSMFTKLSRQMKVAVQDGGSADPKNNLKLEQVIEQAKRLNMPVATIQSVLRSLEKDKTHAKPHIIEIKGPGSCMILCEVFTDHLHQLKQQIATILKKHSSRFVDGGAKALFEEKGVIEAEHKDKTLEAATEDAIEAGAEDVEMINDQLKFIVGSSSFIVVQKNLLQMNYTIKSAAIEYIPLKMQPLSEGDMETCSSLYDKLEALPEMVKLHDNIE